VPFADHRGWRVDTFQGRPQARLAHLTARLVVRPIADSLLRTLFAIEVLDGPPPDRSILISNHKSYWDPLLIATCDPRIKPLGNAYWFDHGPFPWYVRNVRALPNDFRGVLAAVKHLQRGGIVWMAPAGYRGTCAAALESGAAHLAGLADAAVVPVMIEGMEHLPNLSLPRRPRHPVAVRYGEPHSLTSSTTQEHHDRAWREVLQAAEII